MDFEIVNKNSFIVVGLSSKTSLKNPDYKKDLEKLWMDFIPRAREIKNIVPGVFFGTYDSMNGIEGDNCSFDAMACAEVSKDEEIPEGMRVLKIPAAKYFKVTHRGHTDKLAVTYAEIEKLMKEKGFEEDKKKIFLELYDERYVHNSEDSECDILTPLR